MWQKKFGLQSPVCLSNRFTAMFQEFWLSLGGAPADSFLVKFLAFHILSPTAFISLNQFQFIQWLFLKTPAISQALCTALCIQGLATFT